MNLQKLISFRRELHANPELSGFEDETAMRIIRYIGADAADEMYSGVGGHGLLFVFNSPKPEDGPVTVFRADIDALPIQEINEIPHVSSQDGVAHLCGHDGHSTILAGFADYLKENRPGTGKIVLLFQPAEETGKGAEAVIADPKFQNISADRIFGFHNIPGYPKGKILWKKNAFAAASVGLSLELFGKTSHAAYPEAGKNPACAMAEIIQHWEMLSAQKDDYEEMVLLTIVHARLGEKALGTSPGYAKIICTIRAFRPEDIKDLSEKVLHAAVEISKNHQLEIKYEWEEPFPATINHPEALQELEQAIENENAEQEELTEAFRWSEDFGVYTRELPGAFFGIGAGGKQAVLHNPDYDFPDEIIPAGINLYKAIARITNNLK